MKHELHVFKFIAFVYSENCVSCMAYFELWLSINFLLDETDVYRWHWNYRKKFQLKSTPFTLLGDKIAKNNQEDPGESSVNINRKLIKESIQKITFVTGFQPIGSSPAVFYPFLFQLRHSDSNFSSILNGKWPHTTDHKFENNSVAYLKLNFKTGGTKILNQTCGVRTIIYFFLGKQSFRNWLCSLICKLSTELCSSV